MRVTVTGKDGCVHPTETDHHSSHGLEHGSNCGQDLIKEATKPEQRKYVNTSINLNDCASRGLTPNTFMKNLNGWMNWWRLKEKTANIQPLCISFMQLKIQILWTSSSWYQLKRAEAWILRLKDLLLQRNKKKKTHSQTDLNCQRTTANQRKPVDTEKEYSVEELTGAEMEIIKLGQGQQFQEETSMLQRGSDVKRRSDLMKLDPDWVMTIEGCFWVCTPQTGGWKCNYVSKLVKLFLNIWQ